MGHHKKRKKDRTYNNSINNSNSLNNMDLAALSSMLNSGNVQNNNIAEMLNNIDLNQLMSQISSNSINNTEGSENESSPFFLDNDPTINLLNSMRPFFANDNSNAIDNIIKVYAIKNFINSPVKR